MNRIASDLLLRLKPLLRLPLKSGGPRIASNARSPVGATPDTCRFPGHSQQARTVGDQLRVGFLRHRRAKRMMEMKKEGPVWIRQTGPGGHSSRPRLAIPCWVAPLQSPTPFRQATFIILQAPGVRSKSTNRNRSCAKTDCWKRAQGAKTDRTRSPAPTTEHRRSAHDNAENDGPSFDPFNTVAIISTVERPHPFTCRY
jgi:hypothetical protein